MKVRIKPRIIDVIEDDGRYLDKDMTYYDKEDVEPLDELPEGLEEAAEAYSEQVSDGHNYRDLTCGFIAGAQWRDAQGVNYELEVKVDAGGYPYIDKTFELYDYTEDKSIFNPGDKVIVNIRKKEDKK